MRSLARFLQIAGVLLALIGLGGYYSSRDVPVRPLTEEQRELLALDEDDFHASFVVAGRDILYEEGKSEPVYNEAGEITCWRYTGSRSSYGVNTDTILYAGIRNDEVTMTLIPRDLFVGTGSRKINSVYGWLGADGLKQAVEEQLGIPIDYYAIINIDIFKHLVDSLGGVEVNVPVRMRHDDCAAQLSIDLQPGLQVLDGEQASHFVRYRNLPRNDIDRLENVKALSFSMLQRVKQLNIRAVGLLPQLLDTFYRDVETNASSALVRNLLPRAGSFTIHSAGTLPTIEIERDGKLGLAADPKTTEGFLAATFGGVARRYVEPPPGLLLITNASGEAGLGEHYRARLLALGVPADRVRIREAPLATGPSRVLATVEAWPDADYYASLLRVSKVQIDRFTGTERTGSSFELILTRESFMATSEMD